jgi:dTDP-4-amino-4,6-dideoxygalactose transaminase
MAGFSRASDAAARFDVNLDHTGMGAGIQGGEKMWLRIRLDIGWRNLARGFFDSLRVWERHTAQTRLETWWSAGQNDAIACLSVRSGFDLLLQALDLPEESEVLFSAVTIPHLPKIAESHGLVPVPVDLRGSDFHIDVVSLQKAVTPRSRVLVVAHLFGARPDMREVLEVAQAHKLIVVEDCAQAWCEQHWRGDEGADASLFSFGVIKTATVLGGSLCRVKNPQILARMHEIQSRQPVQSARAMLPRFIKFAALKALSSKKPAAIIVKIGRRFGKDIDGLFGDTAHAFADRDLLFHLRHQPAAGTLKFLLHRLQTYDFRRISRRVENARRAIGNLGLEKSRPDLLDSRHSFWLFPFITNRADGLLSRLLLRGFDATRRGSLAVVPPPPGREALGCTTAGDLLNRTVFLPCYCEIPIGVIDDMCRLILEYSSRD